MNTLHEKTATIEAQTWLSSLPRDTQIKTLSTQILKEHWTTKNSAALSTALVDCFKQKAWEKVAFMPSIKSRREVREYKRAVEWIRDCLGVEPDELMRTLTGHQPSAKDASEAVTYLIELIATEEPNTLEQLSDDFRFGKSKMIGWETLLSLMKQVDPEWSKAHERLKELLNSLDTSSAGDAPVQTNLFEASSSYLKDKDSLPSDSKTRLISRLTKLKNNPSLCKSKGTSTERVSNTLDRLLRGLIPSVAAAEREAGLAKAYGTYSYVGVRGNASVVAKKIIKRIGKNSAIQLANQILEVFKND